jgi:phage gpG-like protein
MATDIRVIGDEELMQWFKGMDEAISGAVLVNALKAGGLPIQNAAKQKVRKKTRNLSRSIHMEVEQSTAKNATVSIGTDVEYAAIHEFGGTITPKTGRYLAIPASSEGEQYIQPSNFPRRLHFLPGAGGGVLLDDDDVVHYILRTSVTIPASPYLRPAADEKEDEAVRAIAAALKTQMDRVK